MISRSIQSMVQGLRLIDVSTAALIACPPTATANPNWTSRSLRWFYLFWHPETLRRPRRSKQPDMKKGKRVVFQYLDTTLSELFGSFHAIIFSKTFPNNCVSYLNRPNVFITFVLNFLLKQQNISLELHTHTHTGKGVLLKLQMHLHSFFLPPLWTRFMNNK